MTARSIMHIFDEYQKARIGFVENIANLASKPQNIVCLESAGVLDLLTPLLTDKCVSIQHCAAIAIGRLANHNETIAQSVVEKDVLTTLVKNIDKQNKYYKRAALFVFRAIGKHNAELANLIITSGGLESIVVCVEDFDTGVKVAALWAIGCISKHNANLARAAVDAGVLPLLVLSLQEAELCVKQTATNALADIAKHSSELAQTVADCVGSIPLLVRALQNHDLKLKKQVLIALDAIANHNVDLAEACAEADLFPTALLHIQHACNTVSKAACELVRDTVQHSLELAQMIVNQGGIGALLEAVGDAKLPAITALGYIAGHSDQLALAVAGSYAVNELSGYLEEKDEYLQAAAVWTLQQIGKHTVDHAKKLADANVFIKILKLYIDTKTSEFLKIKCRDSLKHTLQKCLVLSALEPLLYDAPPDIMKYILRQFSKVLPYDPKARRLFVTTGGLRKVQEIAAEPGTTLMEYILIINSCFPEEIVKYYSPGYPETLLEKVEQYTPNIGNDTEENEDTENYNIDRSSFVLKQ